MEIRLINADEALNYYLRPLDPDADKFANGSVLVIAGSYGMTGAAVLCAKAAMRSGAGLVYSALPGACLRNVEISLPEAVKCPLGESGKTYFDIDDADRLAELSGRKDAVVIGPGLGREAGTQKLVRKLLASKEFAPDAKAVVLDADGLYPFTGRAEEMQKAAEIRPGKFVITPHEGEAARLLVVSRTQISEGRPEYALKLGAMLCGGTAVLKGHRTLVTAGGELWENRTGNPGMGTGGSGDVLAGIIAGLAAGADEHCQNLLNVVKSGVAIHGLAGDAAASRNSQRYITASDLIFELGEMRN
ncbi:MAG: NAD(P)H-hydrate dehydratase [Clostridia bacterium]|nr:NAD(P)H-hydrate dehydratase [Clostridia bacterium]